MPISDCDFCGMDEAVLEGATLSVLERGVLMEKNVRSRPILYPHLSASAHRRHIALQVRINREKQRRKRMERQIEYQRLRNMVPALAKKPQVSRVTVIEEAIRYIDHLHDAILDRFKTKGLPRWLQDANVDVTKLGRDHIKNFMFQMVNESNKQSAKPSKSKPRTHRVRSRLSLPRNRSLPSYLSVRGTHSKRCT